MLSHIHLVKLYLFKINNKNVRKCYKICSNLTIRSVVLLFSLLTLLWTYFTPFSSVSFVDFEQENVRWVGFSRITEGMFAYFAVPIGEATDRFPDWEVLSFFLCYMTFCNQEPKTCETCFDLLFIHRKPEEKLLGIPF